MERACAGLSLVQQRALAYMNACDRKVVWISLLQASAVCKARSGEHL